MVLKLLSIQEAKDARTQEVTRDVARTASIKEAKNIATKELNDVQARFNMVMSQQRAQYLAQEEEHMKKIGDLDKEIREKNDQLASLKKKISVILEE